MGHAYQVLMVLGLIFIGASLWRLGDHIPKPITKADLIRAEKIKRWVSPEDRVSNQIPIVKVDQYGSFDVNGSISINDDLSIEVKPRIGAFEVKIENDQYNPIPFKLEREN